MHNGEWSLISFTLLSQISVGLVLALGFLFFMNQTIYMNLSSGISFRSPEFVILILILAATLLSLLHLGSPLHSYNSLNNLKGSWISKEILMLSVFGLGILLFMISKILNWPHATSQLLMVFSMISGMGLILSMVGIYMIPTVPSWNNFYTPVSFFGSALLLGSIGIILFINTSDVAEQNFGILKQLLIFMLVIMGIIILSTIFYHYQISRFKFTGIEQMAFNQGPFFVLFLIRMIFLVIILIGLIYFLNMISNPAGAFINIKTFFLLLFFLILTEEVIGRYLFYASYFRVGV